MFGWNLIAVAALDFQTLPRLPRGKRGSGDGLYQTLVILFFFFLIIKMMTTQNIAIAIVLNFSNAGLFAETGHQVVGDFFVLKVQLVKNRIFSRVSHRCCN